MVPKTDVWLSSVMCMRFPKITTWVLCEHEFRWETRRTFDVKILCNFIGGGESVMRTVKVKTRWRNNGTFGSYSRDRLCSFCVCLPEIAEICVRPVSPLFGPRSFRIWRMCGLGFLGSGCICIYILYVLTQHIGRDFLLYTRTVSQIRNETRHRRSLWTAILSTKLKICFVDITCFTGQCKCSTSVDREIY